ncbi:cytochrome oxidase putative small subunit CydP [Paraburkholderia phosphatilytica]|uniref:cytochrome oxidase putative small subunit CydP n=1 Tax=Paraburkholderia phosphatilytica TaxID=2282883 RepID=UPI000E46B96F|nr:cytochrome oxidase putative small subunit CydP [Paraburkholderia phosphatilytica]
MSTSLTNTVTKRASLRTRLAAWARGPTFARDIVIVLVIKFVLLMTLKYTFFNHPQAENMSLPPAAVAQALLSLPASQVNHGDRHANR